MTSADQYLGDQVPERTGDGCDAREARIADIRLAGFPSDPELAQLQMVYKAADSSVEGISVDAIEFQHPMIQGMGAMVIGPVLGELSAKISVTQVDNNTVIVSIGGGERMLAQTIKRVRSNDGSFMSNPAIAESSSSSPNTTGWC